MEENNQTEQIQIEKLEERITELEIRSAYQDQTVLELDKVLQQYCQLTDNLKRQLQALEQRIGANNLPAEVKNLNDEVPPHY